MIATLRPWESIYKCGFSMSILLKYKLATDTYTCYIFTYEWPKSVKETWGKKFFYICVYKSNDPIIIFAMIRRKKWKRFEDLTNLMKKSFTLTLVFHSIWRKMKKKYPARRQGNPQEKLWKLWYMVPYFVW